MTTQQDLLERLEDIERQLRATQEIFRQEDAFYRRTSATVAEMIRGTESTGRKIGDLRSGVAQIHVTLQGLVVSLEQFKNALDGLSQLAGNLRSTT